MERTALLINLAGFDMTPRIPRAHLNRGMTHTPKTTHPT